MRVRDLIDELRKHDLDLPVVVCADDIYDEHVSVIFNSEVGVEIHSEALDEMIGTILVAAEPGSGRI